jgi:hypothetical protein
VQIAPWLALSRATQTNVRDPYACGKPATVSNEDSQQGSSLSRRPIVLDEAPQLEIRRVNGSGLHDILLANIDHDFCPPLLPLAIANCQPVGDPAGGSTSG